jgi:hypothetical protein
MRTEPLSSSRDERPDARGSHQHERLARPRQSEVPGRF